MLRDPWPPDPQATRWVERTIATLSLREQIGQLVMPWLSGAYLSLDSPEFDALQRHVEEDRVGGFVVSVGLPHSYAAKLNAAQRRARVPLLVASDLESGPGMRLAGIYAFPSLLPQGGGTSFPPVMALGATGSEELAFELGRVIGREARAVGVHLNFGPVLDVNSSASNPIINTRAFGDDPELVARLAVAYLSGARETRLMSTGKHFPGQGDASRDSHVELPSLAVDRPRLERVELPPFRAAIAAGIDAIMTAHVAMVGLEGPHAPPASLSPRVGRLLREELGFRGLLVTDALDMGAVVEHYGPAEAPLRAVEAGADVLLMPASAPAAIDSLVRAVETGEVPATRIGESARRVLKAKARAGLHRERYVALEAVDQLVGGRAHRRVAATIAERSITLVRDSRALVPIARGERVLTLTYAGAADPATGRAFQAELAGAGILLETVRVDERTTDGEFEALRDTAAGFDRVVAAAFVSPRAGSGEIQVRGGFGGFVEALATTGVPVIALSFGSPYLLAAFPSVPAYLLAWGGAEVCQEAAARAALGRAPITGRLPVALPPWHPAGFGIERR